MPQPSKIVPPAGRQALRIQVYGDTSDSNHNRCHFLYAWDKSRESELDCLGRGGRGEGLQRNDVFREQWLRRLLVAEGGRTTRRGSTAQEKMQTSEEENGRGERRKLAMAGAELGLFKQEVLL